MSPSEAKVWLESKTSCNGLRHLDAAIDQKRGVILCGFHFASVPLIAFILMKHGYSPIQVGIPSFFSDRTQESISAWAQSFKALDPNYGAFELLSDFGVDSWRFRLEALRSGRLLISLPDAQTPSNEQGETVTIRQAKAEKLRYFGISAAQPSLKPSRLAIKLFSQHVFMNEWIGWLASATGAAVLPTFMLRMPDGSLRLTVDSPVTLTPSATSSQADLQRSINIALFARLEQYIAQYPLQWTGWHSLQFVSAHAHQRA
jgi:lauroyl/myristoyl acyltransferase